MRKLLSLAVLSMALACRSAADGSSPTEPSNEQVGAPFDLAAGHTASLDGGSLELKFERVAEDSRCPVDVQCIQAGDAVVVLAVTSRGTASTIELHAGVREPREGEAGGYAVRLLDLKPVPRSTVTLRPEDYVARLEVHRQ
jgi:hypothetical protein